MDVEFVRVQDDNWDMLCVPQDPEQCEKVAEHTGNELKTFKP